jgi:hypothetical protein
MFLVVVAAEAPHRRTSMPLTDGDYAWDHSKRIEYLSNACIAGYAGAPM